MAITGQKQKTPFPATSAGTLILMIVGGIIVAIASYYITVYLSRNKSPDNSATITPPDSVKQDSIKQPGTHRENKTVVADETVSKDTQQLYKPPVIIKEPDAKPAPEKVIEVITPADPGTLEKNYGLRLNLSGELIDMVIGSDAILQYFKLNGSHHSGYFIVGADKTIYFTNNDAIKKGQNCSFYVVGRINDVGWSHQSPPCKPFCSVYKKIDIYPCGDLISYKIGAAPVKNADQYTF